MRTSKDNETKIKWLSRYRSYREMHRILSDECRFWGKVKDAVSEGPDALDKWLDEVSCAALCFSDWADKTACVCAEIYTAIMRLDPDISLILSLRYIEGLAWEAIADKLSLSLRQVYRKHARGLEDLDIIEAERKPPSLRYASDYMFHYASAANVVGGNTGPSCSAKVDPKDVFAD